MELRPFSKTISREYRRFSKELSDANTSKEISDLVRSLGAAYGHQRSDLKQFNQPLFFSEKESDHLQMLVDYANNLFCQSYCILLDNPKYLKFLGVASDVIDVKRRKNPANIFRIDGTVLRDHRKLKFIEFNTNNPGGFYNSDSLEMAIFALDPAIKKLSEKYSFSCYSRTDAFLNSVLGEYDRFRIERKKSLGNVVGILSDPDDPIVAYEQIVHSFEQKGFRAIMVPFNSDELKYEKGSVTFGGERLAILNRRVEDSKKVKSLKHIIQASRKGDVCVVNPFSSSILGMKKFYLLLHDSDFQRNLTTEMVDFIQEYVPITIDFNALDSVSYKTIIEQKDKYVIKVNNSEQGNGVFVGNSYSPFEWRDMIRRFRLKERRLRYSKKIVQEFLDMTCIGGKEYDYNLISIGGSFFPHSRVAASRKSKTNIAQGGYYVPCFQYSKLK